MRHYHIRLFLIIWLASLLLPSKTRCQQYFFSTPQKISSKTPNFKILGKNKMGALVHLYGRRDNIVEAYDNEMKLKWQKELKLPNGAIIKSVLTGADNLLVFYIEERKSSTLLFAQWYDAQLKLAGEAVKIDSFAIPSKDVYYNLRITWSADKEKIFIYLPVYQNGDLVRISGHGLDRWLKTTWKKTFSFENITETVKLHKTLIDLDGNVFWLLSPGEEDNQDKRKGYIASYKTASNALKITAIQFPLPVFKEVKAELDNVNGKVVISAFYKENEKGGARGIVYMVYNPDSDLFEISQYFPFDRGFIFSLTGKDSTSFSGLYSFQIDEMIVRFDGGAIIVAESRIDNTESIQLPVFVPSTTPSYRAVTVITYNDILLFSISPDGMLEWHNILRKKQVSEDDDGFYSSYCLVKAPDRLHFIYNEEIYHKTNVNVYSVSPDGNVKRRTLFNASEQNVMIAPRLGRQVAGNEVLIPSFKRNYFRLVKFAF